MENAEPSSDEEPAKASEDQPQSAQSDHVADDPNFSSIRIKSDEDLSKIASQVRPLEDACAIEDKSPSEGSQTDDEDKPETNVPAMTTEPGYNGK